MSDTNEAGQEFFGSEDLSFGATPYIPTQPSPQFVDPFPADSGYTQVPGYTPAPAPSPSSGYPPVAPAPYPATGVDPGYSVYDPMVPQAPQPSYAVQQYAPGYPQPGAFVPGQVVQTAYGTFVVGNKSKLVAGVLGLVLGGFGVGQFYRGNIGLGVLQIVVTLISCGIGVLWGFIEGIVVLVSKPGSPSSLDANGQIMA